MSERGTRLPLPDYDHLPVGTLRHRIRSLSAAELDELLAFEREHANRAPVTTILTARLGELAEGATPSGGDQSRRPETVAGPGPESERPPPVAAPVHPPPHGEPAQPAKPKGNRRP